MSFRYHALGGINDETLRQMYLKSLHTEFQGELQRLIEFSGKSLRDITLGEIHMYTHTALDKLCATQRVFAKMIREDSDDSRISSEHTGYTDPDSPSEVYQATTNGSTGPQVKIQILTTKYSKPVSVIVYFDTGAHSSMMNPNVLPSDVWKEEKNEFPVADGQIFNTYLISKHKVGIQFFPSFTLWTHVIGTPFQTRISLSYGTSIANPEPSGSSLMGSDTRESSNLSSISLKFSPFPLSIQISSKFKISYYSSTPTGNHNIIPDMLSRSHSITLISRVGLIPLIYMISSQALSSTAPPVVPPPPTFPPEFMATLPPGHIPSVQQVHDFTKLYLPRPYSHKPHTRLLWTSNVSYEWDTSYDYERLYRTSIQTPLLNFLCDVNNDKTDVLFILPDVPRVSAKIWHPFQNSYLLDSQDQADTWPCSICRALDSDDEYHSTCNLSSP
ncbi:hypothetical protein Ddye_013087 [Dipteronia dyeriana]|uniref:Uncharacterized protein n=1 Tax=Dipteronia dyeriana TaxID=168575 RepID=A0AAE0CJA7_9ROSI|nr:hypothetical protein Ddye_013087 [Dipteronia dyeriana]